MAIVIATQHYSLDVQNFLQTRMDLSQISELPTYLSDIDSSDPLASALLSAGGVVVMTLAAYLKMRTLSRRFPSAVSDPVPLGRDGLPIEPAELGGQCVGEASPRQQLLITASMEEGVLVPRVAGSNESEDLSKTEVENFNPVNYFCHLAIFVL